MRKLFALAMVAALSLSIALAAVGCGKKAEQMPAESTTPMSGMPADTGMGADTSMGHMGMDTTMSK